MEVDRVWKEAIIMQIRIYSHCLEKISQDCTYSEAMKIVIVRYCTVTNFSCNLTALRADVPVCQDNNRAQAEQLDRQAVARMERMI